MAGAAWPICRSTCLPGDVGIDFDVDETGATFTENAVLKADAYGQASGLLTLAEDSGLCVAALGASPGSARRAGKAPTIGQRTRCLIRLLDGKTGAGPRLPLRLRRGVASSRRPQLARARRSARPDRLACRLARAALASTRSFTSRALAER